MFPLFLWTIQTRGVFPVVEGVFQICPNHRDALEEGCEAFYTSSESADSCFDEVLRTRLATIEGIPLDVIDALPQWRKELASSFLTHDVKNRARFEASRRVVLEYFLTTVDFALRVKQTRADALNRIHCDVFSIGQAVAGAEREARRQQRVNRE